jgi:DNA-binding winged helix-turn-helix (wHTH) protein
LTTFIRYRFGEFVLSPLQRMLWRDGVPVALIPKYFDLLHLLIRRRHEAVSKQAIFSEVWSDVIVSDGALSQAIRILRRTLDDDAREPRFIRTVPRHGYQFVWSALEEQADDGPPAGPPLDAAKSAAAETAHEPAASTLDSLVDDLLRLAPTPATSPNACTGWALPTRSRVSRHGRITRERWR